MWKIKNVLVANTFWYFKMEVVSSVVMTHIHARRPTLCKTFHNQAQNKDNIGLPTLEPTQNFSITLSCSFVHLPNLWLSNLYPSAVQMAQVYFHNPWVTWISLSVSLSFFLSSHTHAYCWQKHQMKVDGLQESNFAFISNLSFLGFFF